MRCNVSSACTVPKYPWPRKLGHRFEKEGKPMRRFLKIETPFIAVLSGLAPLPW